MTSMEYNEVRWMLQVSISLAFGMKGNLVVKQVNDLGLPDDLKGRLRTSLVV